MTQLLDFRRFCVDIISTGDLDPVYYGAVRAALPPDQLKRWLLAYGLFYHVGAASYMSERSALGFWDVLRVAARNELQTPMGGRWPRASERRHFRGEFSVNCVRRLEDRYGDRPETFMEYVAEAAPDVAKVRERVEEHMGFGDWASFKFADLVDRVLGVPVHFDLKTAMYETPTKGARLVHELHRSRPANTDGDAVDVANLIFQEATAGLTAPPLHDRPLAFNELETCLCKFKSHQSGRYPIGKDILECEHAAGEWAPHSETAAKLHSIFAQMKENL